MSVTWKIDECSVYDGSMRLRGWCHAAPIPVCTVSVRFATGEVARLVSYGLASPDVAALVSQDAPRCRFDERVTVPTTHEGHDFQLEFGLDDGSVEVGASGQSNARDGDASHRCWYDFLNTLHALPTGHVLEIGSRARSGITRRELVPKQLQYVGLDVCAGPNVDLVADAHRLADAVPAEHFDAVFALSVFEHLAMPWKVAIEINKVLRRGGLVFVQTPQTWPLHDEPFDFWRYSTDTWPCLFNPSTGFEIVRVADGEPARIVPLWDAPVLHGLSGSRACLNTTVIARKIGTATVDWPVPIESVTSGRYSH